MTTNRVEQHVEPGVARPPVFPSQAGAASILLEYERAAADAKASAADATRAPHRALGALIRPAFSSGV